MNYSDLRRYLKKIIPTKFVRSLFVAGSVKGKLLSGSDVDIFVIAYENKLNSFFNLLTRELRKFVKDNPEFIYSYFRGPIKFENRILLHFIIYTDKPKGKKKIQDFQNEPPQVFENILKKYDLISGENPKNLRKEMNLGNLSRNERENYMKKKTKDFFGKSVVRYSEWKKQNSKWIFKPSIIKLSNWQKEHLEKYFSDYGGEK